MYREGSKGKRGARRGEGSGGARGLPSRPLCAQVSGRAQGPDPETWPGRSRCRRRSTAAFMDRCGSPWSASAGGSSVRPTRRRSLLPPAALGCALQNRPRAPGAPHAVSTLFLSFVTTSTGWVQVRVKWWGEEGYGSLLRPAACTGLGPALTSSLFYSIRCSRSACVARGVLGFRA